MGKKYYSVRVGRAPGVYDNWAACRAQVFKYPGAQYKSFATEEEAREWFTETTAAPRGDQESDDTDGLVHIWVDGSCLTQGRTSLRLGWAYLIRRDGKELHRARGNDIPAEAHTHRNVAGEIMAVLKAIDWCQAHAVTHARIYHDYEGLARWPTNAWKTNTPFTTAYADTVRQSGIVIDWRKVKAHSGDPNNDIVDQEAKRAAQEGADIPITAM